MGQLRFHHRRHIKDRKVGYLRELVYPGRVTPWVHKAHHIPEMNKTENKKIELTQLGTVADRVFKNSFVLTD